MRHKPSKVMELSIDHQNNAESFIDTDQIICFTGVYIADFSVADHKHKTTDTLKNWSKFHFCPG